MVYCDAKCTKKLHYVPVNIHKTGQKSKIGLQSCLMNKIKYLATKMNKIIDQIIKKVTHM